jgi:hypothetical protein
LKKYILSICCTLIVTLLSAADYDYSVLKIDTALLVNANAVKRFEEIKLEVKRLDKVIYKRTYVITILNEKGDDFAEFSEYYDQLQTIESIDGTLYDAFGKKLKNVKKADIQDLSATSNYSLADDNRTKSHNFYHKIYPYTVKYEVELQINNTMFYPGFMPVENEHFAVAQSKMTVSMAPGIEFRYKAYNYKNEPVITADKEYKNYTWELNNFKAIEIEYKSPNWYELTPTILMGPVQFQIAGYTANMASWKDFGQFSSVLKKDRDILPQAIKDTVHQLADGIKDTKQKITALYQYMQQNTRYISVQLGIGGWQPYDAAYVAKNKYGDCKALTNYMYALLKEAGIKSNYTLVKAGNGNKFFNSDFPSSQFNHVILSVPLPTDTMWLECTSQIASPGYLGDFTDDRYALAVTEAGSALVRTPTYKLADNLQQRNITATIDIAGNATLKVNTIYKALQQDELQGMINSLSNEKVKESLNERFNLPNYTLVNYHYKEQKSALPIIDETLQLVATGYANISGKRLFIAPNILTKTQRKLVPNDKRKFDIVEQLTYRDIDTVEINIPTGYTAESLPKDVAIKTKYGQYSSQYKVVGSKIYYYRLQEQFTGRFAANEYTNMVSFYDQIYKADRVRMVFVKPE